MPTSHKPSLHAATKAILQKQCYKSSVTKAVLQNRKGNTTPLAADATRLRLKEKAWVY